MQCLYFKNLRWIKNSYIAIWHVTVLLENTKIWLQLLKELHLSAGKIFEQLCTWFQNDAPSFTSIFDN